MLSLLEREIPPLSMQLMFPDAQATRCPRWKTFERTGAAGKMHLLAGFSEFVEIFTIDDESEIHRLNVDRE